jgi:hypothetical protein
MVISVSMFNSNPRLTMALSHAVEHVQALQNPMKATLGEHTVVLKYVSDVEINKVIIFYDHLVFTSRLEASHPFILLFLSQTIAPMTYSELSTPGQRPIRFCYLKGSKS